jgi:short-subunit dehydrogenase
MQLPKSILITGASSGIGKALAEKYAEISGVILFLTARNVDRLEQVSANCRANGAKVFWRVIDIEDAKTMRIWMEECAGIAPLDLVIANAGISNGGQDVTSEFERKIFATNLIGVLNTVHPAIDLMRQRQHGQIAIISSLASIYGFAYAPAYCASKAAIRVYGEALRNRLKKYGIAVNTICPGFIETPLVAKNPYRMPLIMSAEKAANIISKRLAKNQGLIAFPKRAYVVLWLLRLLPTFLSEQIAGRI